MSKTSTQTMQQKPNQVIQSRKGNSNNNQSVLESDDETTEQFYNGVFDNLEQLIVDLNDELYDSKKKNMAYEKTLNLIAKQKNDEIEREKMKVHNAESKSMLLQRELDQHREKNKGSKNSRDNLHHKLQRLYELKDKKHSKNIEDDTDQMALEIVKKYM